MTTTYSETIFALSIFCGLASAALVFGLTAMAWQRFKDRSFLLLALSSMLFLLILVVDEMVATRSVNDSDYDAYWHCRQIASIVSSVLYPWALVDLFRFIRVRCLIIDMDAKVHEQPPS